MEYEIVPAILEKEWSEIEHKLEIIQSFAKTVHVDIIDGKFANNTTFLDPHPFKKYSSDFFLELHMMVDNPRQYLKPFSEAGFKRFIGHIEMMPDQSEFIREAKQYGHASLAIDGPTNISKITAPLTDVDSLLVMTIKAGFAGQEFDESQLLKVKEIRKINPNLLLEVDGGIDNQTIIKAQEAGANAFCVNSHLFKSDDPHRTFIALQSLL